MSQSTIDSIVCSTCGVTAEGPVAPPSWSVALERGRRVWTCERCARENIRSIEGKLAADWW